MREISSLKPWLITLCLTVLIAGCSNHLPGNAGFTGEGFRSSTPDIQTRAVVWGNNSEAVAEATNWLNDHEILVLYRLAANELEDLSRPSQTESEAQDHMVSVAQRVGAPLVVLLRVHEKGIAQEIDPQSFDGTTEKTIEVAIKGVNAQTKESVFGATVWNSEPRAASDQLVMNLTTYALNKALKEPQTSLPPQPIAEQSTNPREHVQIQPAMEHEENVVLSSNFSPGENPPPMTSQIFAQSSSSQSQEIMENETRPLLYNADEPILEAELQPLNSDSQSAEYTGSEAPGEEIPNSHNESSKGIYIASGALSLLYTPIKVTYAVLGGFFGGFAYILTGGNEDTATAIWDSSLGGTYIISPDHLRGNEAIRFMGPPSNVEEAP